MRARVAVVLVLGVGAGLAAACGDEPQPADANLSALCAGGVAPGAEVEVDVPSDGIELLGVMGWHGAQCVDADCCATASYEIGLPCGDGSVVRARPASDAAGGLTLCNGPINEYPGGVSPRPLPQCLDLAVCEAAGRTAVGTVDAEGVFLVRALRP